MAVLTIEHEVPDLAGWKQIFDNDPMGRASHGVTRHWIYHRIAILMTGPARAGGPGGAGS